MLGKQQKIILCATNQSLTAGLWHGNKLQSYSFFNNVDEDHTAFSQYLAQHPNINLSLVVDAVEEDYRLESLPHTSGNARREMIERKLNQFNRNSQFRTAHFIKRSEDKRKDDNFLFVALNNADFLQNWLTIIQANQAPLQGVYLLPMLSQMIVRQMKLMAPNILLCEHLSSGLRQTYLHNGRLRMSRLAQMNNIKPNQEAYFYLTEVDKSRLYLLSQRLIANETALQMVLPALDESVETIAKSISQEQGVECKTVNILAFAKNAGIDAKLVKAHPELLHMQLLANGHVPDNLAPADLTKTHGLNKVKRHIQWLTYFVMMVGLLLAIYYLWHGSQQKRQISDLMVQTQQQEQLYQEVAKNFPTTPISSSELKIAADLAHNIQMHQQTPRALMEVVSAALEDAPEIVLKRMHWVQSEQQDIKDEVSTAGQAVQATAPVTNSADPNTLWQIGFIDGEIKGFTGDYRAALDTVNALVSRLQQHPLVQQVVITQQPVNVSSLSNLQGSTTDEGTTERTPAAFKIKIVLKPSNQGVAP